MRHTDRLNWRTSSYSGGNGGACVQVASHAGMILVRDTKTRGRGPVQHYTPAAWRTFMARLLADVNDPEGPGRL
jgi:hypothetical protein